MLNNSQNLASFEGFAALLKDEFEKYGSLISFSKDNNPFDADSNLTWFYVIVSGKVKVYEINFETNREQTLYMLIRGDMYDLVTLLDGREHSLASDVLEDGQAIRFPIEKVREWMHKNPAFEQLIYRFVANQMRSLESLAIDLSLYDTKERLLKLLLKNIKTIEHRGVGLLDKLSRTEIANLIGTVRHIIDRHIKELKKEGVLSDNNRKIELKNAEKVLEMLESY